MGYGFKRGTEYIDRHNLLIFLRRNEITVIARKIEDNIIRRKT